MQEDDFTKIGRFVRFSKIMILTKLMGSHTLLLLIGIKHKQMNCPKGINEESKVYLKRRMCRNILLGICSDHKNSHDVAEWNLQMYRPWEQSSFTHSRFSKYPVAYNMQTLYWVLGVKIFKNLVSAFRKFTHRQINMVVAIVICEQRSWRVKKEAAKFS